MTEYIHYMKKWKCNRLKVIDIKLKDEEKFYKIKRYDTLCQTELPINERLISLSENLHSASVIVKHHETLYVYKFLKKPVKSILSYDLFTDLTLPTETSAGPNLTFDYYLSEKDIVNIIIVGAGGNGGNGEEGKKGENSHIKKSHNIYYAGGGGDGGRGGQGGGAGEISYINNVKGSIHNHIKFTIGKNSIENDQIKRNTILELSGPGGNVVLTAKGGRDRMIDGFPGGKGGRGRISIKGEEETLIEEAQNGNPGLGEDGGQGGRGAFGDSFGGGGGGGGSGGRGEIPSEKIPKYPIILGIFNSLMTQSELGNGGDSDSPGSPGKDGRHGIFGIGGDGGGGGGGGGGDGKEGGRGGKAGRGGHGFALIIHSSSIEEI